jgi:hypothetical protein
MARRVIDANLYMTLGTRDPDGSPRLSPVFYTAARYTDFYWLFSPRAQHSPSTATGWTPVSPPTPPQIESRAPGSSGFNGADGHVLAGSMAPMVRLESRLPGRAPRLRSGKAGAQPEATRRDRGRSREDRPTWTVNSPGGQTQRADASS